MQHDKAEMTGHEMLSNLCPYHMSFQPSEIPSTPRHGNDFAENSKADLYAENELCCGSMPQTKWSCMLDIGRRDLGGGYSW